MWKTRFGRCIFRSSDGKIRVLQNFFFRWLLFDSSALQTVINRRCLEQPILHYIKPILLVAKIQQPVTCCLLGLGGGGMAHALAATIRHLDLTAVENNDMVIEVAQRFFMLDKLTHFHLHHKEASLYLQFTQFHVDLLIIDLFTSHSFPSECNNETFFLNCKSRLTDNGLLIVNLAKPEDQWPVFQLIKTIFPYTFITPVSKSNNLLVFACCQKDTLSFLLSKLSDNKKIKNQTWDPIWGKTIAILV